MFRIKVDPLTAGRLRKRADALRITLADMQGPVLVRLGQAHRAQEKMIWSSRGGAGGRGVWPALNPRYAARKRKVFGRAPLMVLTGNTKRRFTEAFHPAYVQRFVPRGANRGVFQFGAYSDIASAHYLGNPSLAPYPFIEARRVFGGRAPRLPIRDVITKSPTMLAQLRRRLVEWYAMERIPQVLRQAGI